MHAISVVEIVGWFPEVVDFIAVLDWSVECCDQVGGEEQEGCELFGYGEEALLRPLDDPAVRSARCIGVDKSMVAYSFWPRAALKAFLTFAVSIAWSDMV